MASISSSSSGKSGKRSLEADLNLVPFIDLLSVCICFLLMTAVWIQVGALQVKQSHGTSGVLATSKQVEVEVKFLDPKSISLQIKKKGSLLKKKVYSGVQTSEAIKSFDLGFDQVLKGSGIDSPKDVIASAMITPGKGVNYGDMVLAMDVLRKREVVNIGVVPVRE